MTFPLNQFDDVMQERLTKLNHHYLSRSTAIDHLHVYVRTPTVDATNEKLKSEVLLDPTMRPPIEVFMSKKDTSRELCTLAGTLKAIELLLADGLQAFPLHLYVDSWLTVRCVRGQVIKTSQRNELVQRLRARIRNDWKGRIFIQHRSPNVFPSDASDTPNKTPNPEQTTVTVATSAASSSILQSDDKGN